MEMGRKDEGGYIVVETLGSFTMLVLFMVAILSLINITVVQARVHYAMTQAAQALSMYSYVLEVTGAAGHMTNMAGQAGQVQGEIDEFRSNLEGVMSGLESLSPDQVGASGEAALGQAQGWINDTVSDPKQTLRLVLNYGLQEVENSAFAAGVKALVGRYLSNGSMTGDEFLKTFGVEEGLDGLTFYDFDGVGNDSILLDADGNVKLAVHYEVNYTFGALPLPFEPSLKISQVVKTKAWLGGSGEGYQP